MNLSSMSRTVQKPPQEANQRPNALPVDADAIPAELKAFPNFVVWRYLWRADKRKWDKPPLNAHTGLNASSAGLATWVSFEEALQAYQKGGYDGIGFALHKKETPPTRS
jgi:primase-polymerase (primpol)-like protein